MRKPVLLAEDSAVNAERGDAIAIADVAEEGAPLEHIFLRAGRIVIARLSLTRKRADPGEVVVFGISDNDRRRLTCYERANLMPYPLDPTN